MSFPTSYVNGRTFADALSGTSFNLDTNTVRASLFTDSVTGADKNAVETYNSGAWTNANEIGSYQTLTNPTVTTAASGLWEFKDSATTLTWTSVTGNIAGVLIYSNTASNRVIAAFKLPSIVSVTAGTFVFTWSENAIVKVGY